MPKYQIILSSDEQIPSDEFEAYIKEIFRDDDPEPMTFTVLEARNLQGIKTEVWQKNTDISDLL
jgi:hypothetical protein